MKTLKTLAVNNKHDCLVFGLLFMQNMKQFDKYWKLCLISLK